MKYDQHWNRNIVTVDVTEIKNAIKLPEDISGKVLLLMNYLEFLEI